MAVTVRDVIFGNAKMADVLCAILKGVSVALLINCALSSAISIVAKPLVAIYGIKNQVELIQQALREGDPVETAVRCVQLFTLIFGLASQCFTGDTLVETEDGFVPIEEIETGDYVWSEDTATGKRELKRVRNVYVSEKTKLVHVETDSGIKIDTTEYHPFYVEERGWVFAAELKAGDVLHTGDGRTETVKTVCTGELDEPVKVYNLEVEDYHTYYVSEAKVLVHNKCGKKDADKDNGGNVNKPTSQNQMQNQMQNQVKKGQAPKEVNRVDKPHVEGQQPHIHFKDGTSLNQDGTIHDAHNGIPILSNKVVDWLTNNGWEVNN